MVMNILGPALPATWWYGMQIETTELKASVKGLGAGMLSPQSQAAAQIWHHEYWAS